MTVYDKEQQTTKSHVFWITLPLEVTRQIKNIYIFTFARLIATKPDRVMVTLTVSGGK